MIVPQSLPGLCPVCEGDGEVRYHRPWEPFDKLWAAIPCPHCSSEVTYPVLISHPGGSSELGSK